MNDSYNALRTRINELLPDRLKLEFGCEVRLHLEAWGEPHDAEYSSAHTDIGVVSRSQYLQCAQVFCDVLVEDLRGELDIETYEGMSTEILGKPLAIEDVLRALDPYGKYVIQANGVLGAWSGATYDTEVWNVVTNIKLRYSLSAPENEAACAAVLKLLV